MQLLLRFTTNIYAFVGEHFIFPNILSAKSLNPGVADLINLQGLFKILVFGTFMKKSLFW